MARDNLPCQNLGNIMKKYIVVTGKHSWSVTPNCAYTIVEAIKAHSEMDLLNYAMKQLGDSVYTFHKDLSFGVKKVGSTEFIVEQQLGGKWIGFIEEKDILKLLEI